MSEKFLKVGTLALLQIVIVGNLQILPPIALYGLSLPLLFLGAVGCFYLPCAVMVSQLATSHPQTGGAYIWCEKAFGPRVGFFAVALLWISNVLWYPSIFSLIAANLAYLFAPELALDKTYVLAISLGIFWAVTLLNCLGVRLSSTVSTICSVVGIIMPILLIIGCGLVWWLKGKPLALAHETPHFGNLISLVVCLFGIELTAVHAGNVVNPKQDYPKSLLISSLSIIALLLCGALAIGAIVPAKELSVMTGLLDALVRFFSEFGGYSQQVASGIKVLEESLKELHGLALGATAVGTGINAPKNFGKAICKTLSKLTKMRFYQAENLFSALSASDAILTTSSSIKRIACTLYKIANDIRWMASGPRAGLGELELPANEAGSSIMPGKVNPTQSEALMMVAAQIIGYDASITFAATQGNFELNVMRPLMAYNLLSSIHLLTDAATSFTERCIKGLKPNAARIQETLSRSLMLATALNPVIGYDKAAKLVQKAHKENKTLKEAALELGLLSAQEFDRVVDPKKMC